MAEVYARGKALRHPILESAANAETPIRRVEFIVSQNLRVGLRTVVAPDLTGITEGKYVEASIFILFPNSLARLDGQDQRVISPEPIAGETTAECAPSEIS